MIVVKKLQLSLLLTNYIHIHKFEVYYTCTFNSMAGKVVPVLIKHYAMKTYGGVDVYIHVFLTLALIRDRWSASCPGCFISQERAPEPDWTMWRGKNLAPTGTDTLMPWPSSPLLIAVLIALSWFLQQSLRSCITQLVKKFLNYYGT
jgi:hypothetical protein